MILRVIKIFIGLAIGAIIGAVIFFWLVSGTVGFIKSAESPRDNISWIIKSYERCEEAVDGAWLQCPVCHKEFFKAGRNFCSEKCEDEFWEMYDAWEDSEECREIIERYGKKYE